MSGGSGGAARRFGDDCGVCTLGVTGQPGMVAARAYAWGPTSNQVGAPSPLGPTTERYGPSAPAAEVPAPLRARATAASGLAAAIRCDMVRTESCNTADGGRWECLCLSAWGGD
eukprot:scaffold45719_cov26-Tisochrysis_lutea.AAC.3